MSFDKTNFLLAGELAKETGVSRDTLRHYERKGVLARPCRAANGYRLYPADEALRRVLLVRRALAVGFTLAELAQILAERDRGKAPCQRVRRLAVTKLAGLEERLWEMQILRDELRGIMSDWDRRLAAGEPNEKANLLESLIVSNDVERLKFTKLLEDNFLKKRKTQK